MHKKSRSSEDQGGKWLTTFNDMVTLLLTFFVLVLSMSKVDAGKVQQASRSVSDAFGMLNWSQGENVKVFDPFVPPRGLRLIKAEKKQGYLTDEINEIEGMNARVIEGGVLVTLDERILFKPGMAAFDDARTVLSLKGLGPVLQKADCLIRVEGHTDDVPIHNEKFSSNWQLSTARAVAVVKYLVSECLIAPERISAAGYADSRPRLPNVSKFNRATNRRVEIVLTLND